MADLLTSMRRLFVVSLLAGAGYVAAQIPASRGGLLARDGSGLATSRSWGYQLQNAAPDRIASSIDVLVIDSQGSSAQNETLSTTSVERFQQRADGSKRIVLAYMSIGEAEAYRFYWQPHWRIFKPSWLGTENKDWKDNHRVRFWEAGWRQIIVGAAPTLLDRGLELVMASRKPYIDRILDAGFDGVYLDRVDAYYDWAKTKPGAEAAMIALVREISSYAKARKPGFLVVPQNAEELLKHKLYRQHIDAIAKEDLYFGSDHTEAANKPSDVSASVALLNLAKAERLPVLVVEYLADPASRAQAQSLAQARGYMLHFADRTLDRPPEPLLNNVIDRPRDQPPPPARPKG